MIQQITTPEGGRIRYQLIRSSRRRTLGISVHRDQSVEVRAPTHVNDLEVARWVHQRSPWIRKHQKKFSTLPVVAPKRFEEGEIQFYLGASYELKIKVASKFKVYLVGNIIQVEGPSKQPEAIQKTLSGWYLNQGKAFFPTRVNVNVGKFAPLSVPTFALKARRMKRRWGSCSSKGMITLSSRLMEYSTTIVDYVMVHELCHLYVPNHSKAFYDLMNQVLPDWKLKRAQLKNPPLVNTS